MDTQLPEMQISLSVILPTAAVLGGAVILVALAVFRSRGRKIQAGTEQLVGEYGHVRDKVSPTPGGHVFVHGELWNAVSEQGELPEGTLVIVKKVQHMVLVAAAVNRGESA